MTILADLIVVVVTLRLTIELLRDFVGVILAVLAVAGDLPGDSGNISLSSESSPRTLAEFTL